MTQTMLERAARAVSEEMRVNRKCSSKDLARAVLMAVREPDDATHDRGDELRYSGSANYGAGDIFTAMIDAILNEPQREE